MVRNYVGTNGDDYKKATKTSPFIGRDYWESWHMAGGFGDDTLIGGDLHDTLHGGGYSHDSLVGGKGNDTYYIDSYSDRIVENYNEGTDTVYSRVNHTLGNNFENLYLIPDNRAVNGFGNYENNYIKGSSYNNFLFGDAGHDTIDGDAGNDTIRGASSANYFYEKDTLIGGSGNDLFSLGIGNDPFYDKSGYADYATVKDFRIDSDRLQLTGKRSDYQVSGSGNGIFYKNDLIATFENHSVASLTYTLDHRTNYV